MSCVFWKLAGSTHTLKGLHSRPEGQRKEPATFLYTLLCSFWRGKVVLQYYLRLDGCFLYTYQSTPYVFLHPNVPAWFALTLRSPGSVTEFMNHNLCPLYVPPFLLFCSSSALPTLSLPKNRIPCRVKYYNSQGDNRHFNLDTVFLHCILLFINLKLQVFTQQIIGLIKLVSSPHFSAMMSDKLHTLAKRNTLTIQIAVHSVERIPKSATLEFIWRWFRPWRTHHRPYRFEN